MSHNSKVTFTSPSAPPLWTDPLAGLHAGASTEGVGPSLGIESTMTGLFQTHRWKSKPSYAKPIDTAAKREQLAVNSYRVLKEICVMPEVKEELEKIQNWVAGLSAALEGCLPYPGPALPKTAFNSAKYSHLVLAGKILEIVRLIDTTPKDGHYYKHMQLIREKIDETVSLPAYQALENEENIAMVNFLQHAGYLLDTQAEGMSVIEEIGREAVEQTKACRDVDQENISGTKVSTIVREAIRNTPGYRKDTLGQILLWIIAHLKKALNGFIDEHIPGGHRHYKPCQLDNTFIYIGDYQIGDQRVRFNLGPSVASDNIFEKAHLLFLKKHKLAHYQHSLEHTDKRGEQARTAIQTNIAQKNEEFFYWRTPLDGDIWKGTGDFAHIQSAQDFHDKLSSQVAKSRKGEETGFYLPEHIFSDTDIQQALDYSARAFEGLVPESMNLSEDENRRLSRAMLLGFTAFLNIRAMQKFGEQLQSLPKGNKAAEDAKASQGILPSMGEACKQDVDRGIIINAATRAFVEMINNGLEDTALHQIVGMIKFRGLEVDDRVILEDRLEAFLDLFDLIGEGDKQKHFIETLQDFERQNPMSIKFIPSNRSPLSPNSASGENLDSDEEEEILILSESAPSRL